MLLISFTGLSPEQRDLLVHSYILPILWRRAALRAKEGEVPIFIPSEECHPTGVLLADKRFVKARKRSQAAVRSGAARGHRPVPILEELSWLSNFVKHRPTETNVETCSPAIKASQMCGPASLTLCGPSEMEACATDSTELMRSSSPCQSTPPPLAIPVSHIAHAVPTAVASASSLSVYPKKEEETDGTRRLCGGSTSGIAQGAQEEDVD
ncbi:uncharacterized protein LOC114547385 [Perca flavescens]|uniref:uncharacterized protein LOC114547385 n=1 Tax=Perca flavescens TaxID=8167 RepID=UPI00106E7033|nr:uncharacterized protein LOC114547385 [Perca flavescens]